MRARSYESDLDRREQSVNNLARPNPFAFERARSAGEAKLRFDARLVNRSKSTGYLEALALYAERSTLQNARR